MRNILTLGFAFSGLAAATLLLAACETYPSEYRNHDRHGSHSKSDDVIILTPEAGRSNHDYDKRDDHERHEENDRHGDDARHDAR